MLLTMYSTGQLTVSLPNITALTGQTVEFPVYLSGAGTSGTPISSANVQISYDPAVLQYDTLSNFYSAMPVSQWFFSGNNNMVSANWLEPSLLTLAIPDSTVLFVIRFTYLGGNQILPFLVTEFTDATFEFIPTTAFNGSIGMVMPSLSGPVAVCQGTTGNVYSTQGGFTDYQWNVSGGLITTGGGLSDSTVTVTWNSYGTKNVSVSFAGSDTAVMNVSVEQKKTVSVSISASQNPISPGTMVTFTASAVNGGTAPHYEWKVNGIASGDTNSTFSYVPGNGDQVFCLVTASLSCVNNPIATSNVITMNVIVQHALTITLPQISAMPGNTVIFPVRLSGAGLNGIPVSSINVQIGYDPAILQYDTLVGFYSAMPSSQWFFSGNNNLVSANWIEPSLLTLAIPDSSILFEIKFTYLGGNGSLPFITYEFTDATFEFIPTLSVPGSITQRIDDQISLQNLYIVSETDTCFNATEIISVAGNGTTFTIENGGSATMISGQKILLLPGTSVLPGGYLHARITPDQQYCEQLPNPVTTVPVADAQILSESFPPKGLNPDVRLFPNPTTDRFTVSAADGKKSDIMGVTVHSVSGSLISKTSMKELRKCEISLGGSPPGIYFVHIILTSGTTVHKIIKY